MPQPKRKRNKYYISLALMSLLYLAAGVNHFIHPGIYMAIMPPYLPYHEALVYISGVCEIALALLLIPERSRPIGAWLIITLLIAVFPANVQMAINHWTEGGSKLWIALLRLPLQIPLIAWAYQFTKPRQKKVGKETYRS